jgi:calcineurin-like phosphoesterase family protein
MNWFTADLHLGCKCFGLRAEHFPMGWDDYILDSLQSNVRKGDRLYILGDLCYYNPVRWVKRLPKDTWVIQGNHDASDTAMRASFGTRYRHTYMAKVCGKPTWLSHYCHAVWPASHKGSYHLYGHTHAQREKWFDRMMPGRRSMDVCPDNVFQVFGSWRPVNEEEIDFQLSSRIGHEFGLTGGVE